MMIQQIKTLLKALCVIFLYSCNYAGREDEKEWKTIELGDYQFDFPPDFKLKEKKGLDSYVGVVEGDSIKFYFDFGYYTNSLSQTPEEYLKQGDWRFNLAFQFMKDGITYDERNMPKVIITGIRPTTPQDSAIGKGCEYVADCLYDKYKFKQPVCIPNEIKQLNFCIDTIDNQYRKIVFDKNPEKGITGVYIRSLNGFDKSMNNYLALLLTTNKLTSKQQQSALKIFKTVRCKNKKHL